MDMSINVVLTKDEVGLGYREGDVMMAKGSTNVVEFVLPIKSQRVTVRVEGDVMTIHIPGNMLAASGRLEVTETYTDMMRIRLIPS
jgi:hypothetical protein